MLFISTSSGSRLGFIYQASSQQGEDQLVFLVRLNAPNYCRSELNKLSKAKLVRNSFFSSIVASLGPYEGSTDAFEDAALDGFGVPSRKDLQICRPRVNPHQLLTTPYHPIILFSHIADWNFDPLQRHGSAAYMCRIHGSDNRSRM